MVCFWRSPVSYGTYCTYNVLFCTSNAIVENQRSFFVVDRSREGGNNFHPFRGPIFFFFFCFLISKIQRWGISFSCSTARDASHKTMSHLFPSFSPFLCQGQIKLFLLSCREIEWRGEKGKSEFCASLNPPDIFWSPSRTTYNRNYLLAILKRKKYVPSPSFEFWNKCFYIYVHFRSSQYCRKEQEEGEEHEQEEGCQHPALR